MSNSRIQYLRFTSQQILFIMFFSLLLACISEAQTANDMIKNDSISINIKEQLCIEQTDIKSTPSSGEYRSIMEWKLMSRRAREASKKKIGVYKCPQHPLKFFFKDGKCPDCNSLLKQNAASEEESDTTTMQHKHPE